MEHGKELLILAANVLLFCCAVILLIRQKDSYMTLLSSIKSGIQSEPVTAAAWNPEEETTNRAELIATLCMGMEYDVEINGIVFQHAAFTLDQLTLDLIAEGEYDKTYWYDEEGQITRIVYTLTE